MGTPLTGLIKGTCTLLCSGSETLAVSNGWWRHTQHCLHNHACIHTHMGYKPIVSMHTNRAMLPLCLFRALFLVLRQTQYLHHFLQFPQIFYSETGLNKTCLYMVLAQKKDLIYLFTMTRNFYVKQCIENEK